MTNLVPMLEAILFASAAPLSIKRLAKISASSEDEVKEALDGIEKARNVAHSGIHLLRVNDEAQFVTNPAASEIVKNLSKEDFSAELTRPSLETLTIIAYRGPVTKPEIEAIRGVNCGLILRNLLVRGLIEEKEGAGLQPTYILSSDALRYLGITKIEELPDYAELHHNAHIETLLKAVMTGEEQETRGVQDKGEV